ncbi:glycoside hydrolase family 65 protein [Periweissella cryptocerci]|uniref:Glycoside hydrolase family 65 protein n=1 Tax=Periweissella cryptocerci TaxID=2506420 RepID=A0A4P6YU80_9LACO|nr:glycoside hydrolase family 65 protein [Periweissella cryptocerci]QBO36339.1 glycoside hydrolase family 65 protein [Periweissella cryptocerci]
MKRTFEVQPWNVVSHDLNQDDKRLQESMTSLGNGYMGMRGFFEEDYSADTLQGLYLGGVWYPDKTRVGWWKNGYPEYFGKAINAVNYIKMNIAINGEKVDLATDEISDFSLDLDMKNAQFTRSFTVTKGAAKVAFKFERFLSIEIQELSVQRVSINNLSDAAVDVTVDANMNADVVNEDSNYDEHFWSTLSTKQELDRASLVTKTTPNPFGTPQFTVAVEQRFVTDLAPKAVEQPAADEVSNEFVGSLAAGATTTIEKRVVLTTSRDYDTEAALTAAVQEIGDKVAGISYDDLFAAHAAKWAARWEIADVTIEGSDEAQQGIRFNLFQLFSTYYGDDSRLNIGPKGFTGEKYGGATYWDTEAFAIPVYLGVTDPSVTKNLLKYRYQQIEGAYHNAKQQGLKGALYPMVTFDGIECHNEWEITFEEIHRNSTIAFAIYNYTHITGDKSWVQGDGSEVLIGIARFWADRVHYSALKDKYMIHGVTGPNEYENNINNNWYTNYMAKWVLQYALEILPDVDDKNAAKLAVTDAEKTKWQEIIDKMYLGEADYEGKHIFVQHDTYLDKDLTPVAELDPANLPLNQKWSWDHILRSPYIKQADVLQGMYYFIDNFTEKEKADNFNFYEPLTVHESSLSASVHSIIAADLHMEDKAVEMYERTARLDLDNYNNDTSDGLHITAMTGAWLSIVQGFAGMRVRNDELHFAPFLPKAWDKYHFRFYFRGRLLEVAVDKAGSSVTLLKGEPLTIDLDGQKLELK